MTKRRAPTGKPPEAAGRGGERVTPELKAQKRTYTALVLCLLALPFAALAVLAPFSSSLRPVFPLLWLFVTLTSLVVFRFPGDRLRTLAVSAVFLLALARTYAADTAARGESLALWQRLDGRAAVFEAALADGDAAFRDGMILAVTAVDGVPLRTPVRVYAWNYTEEALPEGAFLTFSARLAPVRKEPDDADDFAAYLRGKRVFLKAGAAGNFRRDEARDVFVPGARLRSLVGKALDRLFSESANPDAKPLGEALLTGDKRGFDADTLTAFRRAGITHLLCVSGLHVSVLVFALRLFLALFFRSGKLRRLLTALAVLGYLAVCGFTPSAVRAAVMAFAAGFRPASARRGPDLLPFLAACAVITLLDPYAVFDTGLQLSFAATFGVLLAAESVRTLRVRFAHAPTAAFLLGALAVSADASLFTFGIGVAAFGGASLLSPLSTLLCLWPAQIGLVVLFAALPFAAVLPQAFLTVFGALFDTLAAFVCDTAARVSALPIAYVTGQKSDAAFVLFAFLLCLAGCVASRRTRPVRIRLAVLAATVASLFAALFAV